MAEKKDRLTDDAVEYWLFPVVDTSLNQETKRTILLENIDTCLAFVSSTIVEHIWQKEQFNLIAVTDNENLPPHLYGKTCYGDNIEDEWLIVYLLFNLTKQFEGLVAKIRDSDEEFMLIEAADHLPTWLEPDTAENRVYIYQGNIHIIPMPQSPAQITTLPSGVPGVQYAVKCVRNYNTATLATPEINNAVQQRLEVFPDKVKKEMHHAHCYMPANLAMILDIKPSLISAGVNSFYYRDPLDLKACRTMKYFRPGTRVISRVKFTRCLYAQLVQQDFQSDKRSGFQMPSTSNPKYLSHDLGMKLAHGFEILCSKCSSRHQQNSNDHNLSPENDVRWQRYLKSLIKHGYFRNELEGSKLYKQLLEKAKQFYTEQIDLNNRMNGSSSQGEEVLDILDRITVDIEQLRDAGKDLEPPDDDKWLQISPEELDKLMYSSSGLNPNRMAGDASDLNKLGDGMKAFVNKVSGVDGAEFPGEDDDIQFDGTGFITQMQKMFEFDDNDGASSSDMSEYGWDDSDEDVDDQPPVSKSGKKGKGTTQPSVKDYMDMMDRELATTEVGKSFEKVASEEKPVSAPNVKVNGKQKKSKSIEEEDDDFRPVDIDMTVVKNMLQSLESQQGLAGPASNILGSMGIKAPAPMAEEDDDDDSVRPSNVPEQKKSGPTIPPRPKPTDLPVAPPRHRRSPKKSSDSKPPLVVRQESNV